MDYHIRIYEGFSLIGLSLRTTNDGARSAHEIPHLWERFFEQRIEERILNRVDEQILGLYTDYEGDFMQPYTLMVGCRVSTTQKIPPGMCATAVPASTYAVFKAKGMYPDCMLETWCRIWELPLRRTYTGDFEVYMEQFTYGCEADVDIAIAIQPPLYAGGEESRKWTRP